MAININPGAPLRLVQTFTSSGTFSVPLGATLAYVSVEGASGGGSGSRYQTDPQGGNGVLAAGWVQVVGGAGLAVTIGAGGAASPSSLTGSGSSGGTTEFAGAITVTGGQGGGRYSQMPSGSASFGGTTLPTLNPGANTLVRVTGNTSQSTGGALGGRSGSRYSGGPTAGQSGKVHIFL